jgi:hypothetical protein
VPEGHKSDVSDLSGSAEHKRILLGLDLPGWAWEFLRRDPLYKEATHRMACFERHVRSNINLIEAANCAPEVRDWGICFCEDAELPYLDAAVFWRADADPGVLRVSAKSMRNGGKGGIEAIDFRKLKAKVTVLKLETGIEYVRITSGLHSIQLEVFQGSVIDAPVCLTYHIDGFRTLAPKVVTLERLFAFKRLNRFPTSQFFPDKRRHRWLLALRALDMHNAGLNHRQIAAELFGIDQDINAWRDSSDWIRSRVRRTINFGLELMNGGYLEILSGKSGTRASAPGSTPRKDAAASHATPSRH